MAGATPTFSFFSTSFGPTREDLTRSLGRHADSLAGLANSHWPLHELERARLARVKLALQRLRKANRLTRRTALLSGADQVRALAREAKEESERAARESERARVYNKLALPSSSSEQDADADDDDGQTVLGYARLLAPFTSAPPSSLRPDTAAAGESAEQQQQRLPAGGRVPFPTEAHLRAGRLWALSQGVQIPGRIPGGGETAEIGGAHSPHSLRMRVLSSHCCHAAHGRKRSQASEEKHSQRTASLHSLRTRERHWPSPRGQETRRARWAMTTGSTTWISTPTFRRRGDDGSMTTTLCSAQFEGLSGQQGQRPTCEEEDHSLSR